MTQQEKSELITRLKNVEANVAIMIHMLNEQRHLINQLIVEIANEENTLS
jgi:hypothetical protein